MQLLEIGEHYVTFIGELAKLITETPEKSAKYVHS